MRGCVVSGETRFAGARIGGGAVEIPNGVAVRKFASAAPLPGWPGEGGALGFLEMGGWLKRLRDSDRPAEFEDYTQLFAEAGRRIIVEITERFLAASRLIVEATSFGGVHTSAERRARCCATKPRRRPSMRPH